MRVIITFDPGPGADKVGPEGPDCIVCDDVVRFETDIEERGYRITYADGEEHCWAWCVVAEFVIEDTPNG